MLGTNACVMTTMRNGFARIVEGLAFGMIPSCACIAMEQAFPAMSNPAFNLAVLKAQGVPPEMAEHIVAVTERLKIENAKLRKQAARKVRAAFRSGWRARAQSESR